MVCGLNSLDMSPRCKHVVAKGSYILVNAIRSFGIEHIIISFDSFLLTYA